MTQSPPAATMTQPTQQDDLLGTALLGGLVSCGIPLVLGILGDWSGPRIAAYALLAAVWFVLSQAPRFRALAWLMHRIALFLVLMGLLTFGLLVLSGDQFVQPLGFAIPYVYAAFGYRARGAAIVGIAYLALMVVGLWIGGVRENMAFVLPIFAYAALWVLLYGFATLWKGEQAARQRADLLAGDLARERDQLARLAQINATLTHDLALDIVLAQVASAGCDLSASSSARVWLRDPAAETHGARLAVVVPFQAARAIDLADDSAVIDTRVPTTTGDGLLLPLAVKGQPIGVLELRRDTRFELGEAEMLQPFVDAAAVAIENARLYEQARLSATLAERNRLARELHDTIAQGLTAVTMQLDAALRSFHRDAARTRARVGRAHELARAALDDVRRSVWTLAEPLIDGATLVAALGDQAQRFAARTGLRATYEHTGAAPPIDHAAATQVLRIVQEALQNVEKHAHASAVEIRSSLSHGDLRVCVRDDGIGFDRSARSDADGNGNGFGLISLHERARLAGGTIAIDSAPGSGTRVELIIPDVEPIGGT